MKKNDQCKKEKRKRGKTGRMNDSFFALVNTTYYCSFPFPLLPFSLSYTAIQIANLPHPPTGLVVIAPLYGRICAKSYGQSFGYGYIISVYSSLRSPRRAGGLESDNFDVDHKTAPAHRRWLWGKRLSSQYERIHTFALRPISRRSVGKTSDWPASGCWPRALRMKSTTPPARPCWRPKLHWS
jgi:hypothetical protein